jgi:hypothetical protein
MLVPAESWKVTICDTLNDNINYDTQGLWEGFASCSDSQFISIFFLQTE